MKSLSITAFTLLSTAVFALQAAKAQETPAGPATRPVAPVLNFTMKTLAGKDAALSDYQGKVILILNTASKCGNTPQYGPLEALYNKYSAQGFVILGFPSNDFGHQEPGTDEQISTFCTTKYGVTFPMFSKVDVLGDSQCPLYKFLTSEDTDPKFPGKITWNFEKFLIAKDGTIVKRFTPKTQPNSDDVVSAIEAELAK